MGQIAPQTRYSHGLDKYSHKRPLEEYIFCTFLQLYGQNHPDAGGTPSQWGDWNENQCGMIVVARR